MKRILGIFAVIFIAAIIGQSAFSQNLKFGHLNRTELIQAMPEYDSALVTLEKLNTELTNTAELLQVELNKNLTDLVRQTKETELNDSQRRLTEFQTNAQTTMQEKQVALFTPITQKADKAIKDVGKENGFVYVFDTSIGAITYFDETKSTNVLQLVKTKLGIK